MSKKLTRREFVQTSTAAGVALGASPPVFGQAPAVHTTAVKPVVVASNNGNVYKNGGTEVGVQKAFNLITKGADVLDALIAGVNICELDPADTQRRLRRPAQRRRRRAARLVLHARADEARRRRRRLEGVRTPSLVAKAVLEQTDHHLLVGKGAQDFARNMGFKIEDDLNTEKSRRLWLEWKRRIDPEHYLDPKKRGEAMHDGGPQHGARRPDRSRSLLRHDQLRRRQQQGRGLRRDHDERAGVEDSGPRRRFADPRRRPLRRRRRRRRRIDRPRRGQSLQPLLVPDRRADARWASRRRTPAWKRCGASRRTPSRSAC